MKTNDENMFTKEPTVTGKYNKLFSIDGFNGNLIDMEGKLFAIKTTYWERIDGDTKHIKVVDRFERVK